MQRLNLLETKVDDGTPRIVGLACFSSSARMAENPLADSSMQDRPKNRTQVKQTLADKQPMRGNSSGLAGAAKYPQGAVYSNF